MDIEQFFTEYAWEGLEKEQEVKGDISCKNTWAPPVVEQNINSIQLYRNGKYEIYVKAEGMLPGGVTQDRETKPLAGTIITGGEIVCDTVYHGIVTMRGCIWKNHTVNYKLTDTSQAGFEACFKAYEVNWERRTLCADMEEDTLIEWYLNGVGESALFCDCSEVVDTVRREISRAGSEVQKMRRKEEHYSRDCVFVPYLDTGVLVRRIEAPYEPKWSKKLALEYRTSYGRIPDKEEREKVAELISFLLGRHLILVGDTSYCGGIILESNMYHPNSGNPHEECSCNTLEVIPLHVYHSECENFRSYAQKLLPAYLELRDEYNLNLVLERYWLANTMPIGVNIPILSGGIESMLKTWFKGNKSRTKGVYIPKEEYEFAVRDVLEQLEIKLGNCENKDKLIKKISSAYQIGANERFFTFLDELGLRYGEAEKESIKARNIFTHGDGNDKHEEVLKNTRTMYLLFARIILKLLGYNGEYIDTSLPGYPRKHIDERIG